LPEVAAEDAISAAVIILRVLCGLSEASQLVMLQPEKGEALFWGTSALPGSRKLFVSRGRLQTS